MNKIILIFIFVVMISSISALCEEEQIDINSASLEELDEFSGIGPVKAQAIIDTRPFNSVDDLIDVYGIGDATLNNIKEQGLACVDDEEEEVVENVITGEVVDEVIIIEEETIPEEKEETNVVPQLIELTPKDINSEENGENEGINLSNYATYALAGFCVLLAILFAFKLMQKKNKTEFDENE